MHWIGAHFCVCMFLDSRDKSLKKLKLCRNDQKNERTKEAQSERPCCGIRVQFTKCTIYPRNEGYFLKSAKQKKSEVLKSEVFSFFSRNHSYETYGVQNCRLEIIRLICVHFFSNWSEAFKRFWTLCLKKLKFIILFSNRIKILPFVAILCEEILKPNAVYVYWL